MSLSFYSRRLAILSNLPETLPPTEYAELLPTIDRGKVEEYHQQNLREQDWCELPDRRSVFFRSIDMI